MPGSSGSGSDADFLPVSERPEWADVAPRPPPVQEQPVVAIQRDELMGDLMDFFWAAVAAGECRWVQMGWSGAGERACTGGARFGCLAMVGTPQQCVSVCVCTLPSARVPLGARQSLS